VQPFHGYAEWLRNPVIWPPSSPDLNTVYFFLWECIKERYDHSNTIIHILVAATDIRDQPRQLVTVRDSTRHRCKVCVQAGGSNFEQFL
jgi:hypothetical protein